jgi:hypothetical protein
VSSGSRNSIRPRQKDFRDLSYPDGTPFAEPDLFGAPMLPRLSFRDMIIDARGNRADRKDRQRSWCRFAFRVDWAKRLTRSFGWCYDFDNGRFAEAEPS